MSLSLFHPLSHRLPLIHTLSVSLSHSCICCCPASDPKRLIVPPCFCCNTGLNGICVGEAPRLLRLSCLSGPMEYLWSYLKKSQASWVMALLGDSRRGISLLRWRAGWWTMAGHTHANSHTRETQKDTRLYKRAHTQAVLGRLHTDSHMMSSYSWLPSESCQPRSEQRAMFSTIDSSIVRLGSWS